MSKINTHNKIKLNPLWWLETKLDKNELQRELKGPNHIDLNLAKCSTCKVLCNLS